MPFRFSWTLLWKAVLACLPALLLPGAALFAGAREAPPAATPAQIEFFEQKVRPLLLKQCGNCHGEASQQGGLRLDSREGFLKGGKRGALVDARQPEKSLLLRAVSYREKGLQMPPTRALAPERIALLTAWVRMGAPFPQPAEKPQSAGPLWSVQPLRRPEPPTPRRKEWTRGPIDRFILAKLEAQGMTPAPPAGKRELLRRVTFDLIGLPPTPEEVAAFLADKSPNAYEKVVDRLLASPRYGERWARYWLDLVRYADSSGYERDAEKPYSWKYRDYVIRAFNTDKPYDRFITEQLAGDEVPDRSEETVVATGFLRLGTWDDEPNDPVAYRYDRLDDLVHATSTAFLSLTVRCARCHDHKFDPIPQKDYYAFANAFAGGFLEPGPRELQGGPPPGKVGVPALAFTERGRDIPPLRLLHNGDPAREGEAVPPGFLSLIRGLPQLAAPPPPDATTTHRRLQLARWLTHPDNPLTARVFVNRLWQHHFGSGLVRTPNNFGSKGDLPTHPELLDWLAADFQARGWKIKRMHRQIVLSQAYRMASQHPQQARYARKDADNRLLWRMNRRRLDADALRDALLAVGGELNLKEGGRGFLPTVTREALEGLSRKGAEWNPSPPDEQKRRSVYMFLKRALIPPLMTVFDFGDTTAPLEQRDVTIGAPQALALMNNPFLHERSAALARRVAREAGPDRARQVTLAWRLAFGRSPTEPERRAALAHLLTPPASPKVPRASSAEGVPQAGLRLWLRADRGVTADAQGRAAAWQDQSGQGFHARQSAEAARPLLISDALNGKPALRFDGRSDFLNLAGQVLASQQFSILAVVRDTGPPGAHREIFSNWNGAAGNIGTSVFLGTTGSATVRFTDAFPAMGRVQSPQSPFLLTGIADAGGVAVYQNWQEMSRVASALPPRNLLPPYVLGQQGSIQGEFWQGDIAEILVYDRALSDAEREQVWDALAARYALAPRPRPADPALASLCHVLLNTNEFLFVD